MEHINILSWRLLLLPNTGCGLSARSGGTRSLSWQHIWLRAGVFRGVELSQRHRASAFVFQVAANTASVETPEFKMRN